MVSDKKEAMTRRENGEGSIYKMGNGRYGAAISLGCDENGHRLRKVITGISEEAVREKMSAWIETQEQTAGLLTATEQVPSSKMVMEEAVKDFIRNYMMGRVSSRTLEGYIGAMSHISKYFQGICIKDIDVYTINKFFTWLKESKNTKTNDYNSQTTLSRTHHLFKKLMERARKKGYISATPFEDFDIISVQKSLAQKRNVDALTQEEIGELIGTVKTSPIFYPITMLLLYTGLRAGEVLGIKWECVDFKRNALYIKETVSVKVEFDDDCKTRKRESIVKDPKTGSSVRTILINDSMADILMQWKKYAAKNTKTKFTPESFVFGNTKNER